MNNENQERQLAPSIEVLPSVDTKRGSMIDPFAIIEQRNQVIEKLRAYGIKQTTGNDWTDMGGDPYCDSSGCQKIARALAMSMIEPRLERQEHEDAKGKYYVYVCYMRVKLPGDFDIVDSLGTASARDAFFSTYTKWNPQTREKEKFERAIEDIDVTDIMKKAYTNSLGNGVRKLVGLEGLTWEGLKQYGIKRDGRSEVQYDGKDAERKQAGATNEPAGDGKAPIWKTPNGYMKAREGRHFSPEILSTYGFKRNDDGSWWAKYDAKIFMRMTEEAAAANVDQRSTGESVDQRQPGSDDHGA